MIIDNVVILGRAVPEEISGGRKTVCVAGYSEKQGFVRLYPTRPDSPLQQWNMVTVEVERNPQDTRTESWKFPNSKEGWDAINRHIKNVGILPEDDRLPLLDRIKSECVRLLNEQHISLGVIRPVGVKPYLDRNEKHHEAYQPLFEFVDDSTLPTKRDCHLEPRIKYACEPECKGHDQQLLDWGCYVYMQKHPDEPQNIWRNLALNEPGWTHYFLVGNQVRHRTGYMVINVLRKKATMFTPSLFG